MEQAQSPHPLSLPPVLRAFVVVTMALAFSAVFAEYVCVQFLHLDRVPYSRMTLDAAEDYADTGLFPSRFDQFHTPAFFDHAKGADFLYPAPVALFYRFFHFFPNDTNFFLAFLAITFLGLAGWLFRELRRRGLETRSAAIFVAGSLLFSYPFYFEFNRANMEIFVWGMSALGVLFLSRDRPWLAACCIGFAGACKGYPFFYLGLFLVRRRYWQTVFCLGFAGLISVVSFWAEAGSFTVGRQGTAKGLEEFRQIYVLHRRFQEIGLDHSLFGFIKRVWVKLPPPEVLSHDLTIYFVVAGAIVSAVYFLRVRKLPFLNQVLFLTIACITLPPVSYDYTLLHLYTPWVMLIFLAVDAWLKDGSTPRGLWWVGGCFMVLLSPQTEIILHGQRLDGQIKCVVLLLLAWLALWIRFDAGPEPMSEGADGLAVFRSRDVTMYP